MKYAFEISNVRGDYLRDCDFRRFAGTPLRLLVTGFVVLAASNKCRISYGLLSPCHGRGCEFESRRPRHVLLFYFLVL